MYLVFQHFSVDHFSGCEITDEGMKSISSFLCQDGIVLEELSFSMEEKNQCHINWNKIKQEAISLEMKVVLISLKNWQRTKQWKYWILMVLLPSTQSLLQFFRLWNHFRRDEINFKFSFTKRNCSWRIHFGLDVEMWYLFIYSQRTEQFWWWRIPSLHRRIKK